MKFIHLTDTHLVKPGALLKGLDPAKRLDVVLDRINRDHADAECCIVTGDLADAAEDEAYKFLLDRIEQSPINFHVIAGNHDDRQKVSKWLPDTPIDESGYLQYVLRTSGGVFVILDTVNSGTHGGVYCEQRQEWLKKALDAHKEEPVFLFMHHPPFDLQLSCIDCIGLEDQQGFARLVQPYTNIRHLFFGHAHRPLSGNWNGISFSSLRGTNHQVGLDFQSDTIRYVDELPDYSIVFVTDNTVVVHTDSCALT